MKFIQNNKIVSLIILIGLSASFLVIVNAYRESAHNSKFNFNFEKIFCSDCVISTEEEAFITFVSEKEKRGELPFSESAGVYTDYSPEALLNAGGKDIVIFFKADWCSTCRLLDAHLKVERDMIPSDVVILRADFDTERELKIRYGIVVQHSLIQVTSAGKLIKKWSGGTTLKDVLSQIQ